MGIRIPPAAPFDIGSPQGGNWSPKPVLKGASPLFPVSSWILMCGVHSLLGMQMLGESLDGCNAHKIRQLWKACRQWRRPPVASGMRGHTLQSSILWLSAISYGRVAQSGRAGVCSPATEVQILPLPTISWNRSLIGKAPASKPGDTSPCCKFKSCRFRHLSACRSVGTSGGERLDLTGSLAEWFMAPVLKTGKGNTFVSSNLTASSPSSSCAENLLVCPSVTG